jgi:cobalt-zinc-cadmium efflux system membrane fusion protein
LHVELTIEEAVMMRRLIASVFIALNALGAGLGWASAAQPKTEFSLDARQQTQLGVRTSKVQPATAQRLMASCTVSLPPGREWLITAPYSGVITELRAGLGDTTRQGAPLLSLSSAQLADARRMAREAQLEASNASAALQRDQAMYDEGLSPAARLQLTQNRQRASDAAWQAHTAGLRAAGLAATPGAEGYASGTLTAPRRGTVLETHARVGQHVEAGEVLLRMANLQELQLDIALAGDKAAQLRPGDAVFVPSRDAHATLTGVSPALDTSGQARARARVTTLGRLQVGEVLAVQIQAAREPKSEPAWEVPTRAVIHHRNSTWVFAATAQGYTLLPVQVLSNNDEQAVVQGPLSAEARVASAGLAALRALLDEGP